MTAILHAKKIAQLTGHKASVFSLTPGPDARHLYSGAGDGWIVLWDLDHPDLGKLVAKVENQIFSLLYLPESEKIVAGNMNGGIHWVDIRRPEQTRNIAHHRKGVFDILRIGEHLYTAGGEGLLTRWSIAEGRSLESLLLTHQSLRCLDYHPERHEIAVGASDNAVYLLDAGSLEIRKTLAGAHDNSVFSVKYHPDGRHLLTGGRDAHLKVWDLSNDLQPVSSQPAHWYTINDMAFHPAGRWFATASRDKTIKIWDAGTFELLKVLDSIRDKGHINSVNRLYWSSYHNRLISCSDDRSIIIWGAME